MTPELIVLNADIHTMGPARRRAQALAGDTTAAAALRHGSLCRLASGTFGDLMVIDRNISRRAVADNSGAQVLLTALAGRIVHDATGGFYTMHLPCRLSVAETTIRPCGIKEAAR